MLASLLLLGATERVAAQDTGSTVTTTASIDVASIKMDAYLPSTITTMATSISGTNGRLQGSLFGEVSRFESGHMTQYGAAEGVIDLHAPPPSHATLGWDSGIGGYRGAASARYARLSFSVSHSNLWADVAGGRASGGLAYSTSHLGVGASIGSDQVATAPSVAVVRTGRGTYTDFRCRTRATLVPFRGVQGELSGGIRVGDDVGGARRWMSVSTVIPVFPRLVVMASVGVDPPDVERAMTGARYASLSVRLTPGGRRGPGMVLQRAAGRPSGYGIPLPILGDAQADGSRVLIIHTPAADSVELMGDFTQWLPVRLTRAGPATWVGRVSVGTGAHRVDIRVDGGEWKAPAGLPEVADEFGGVAGLLVVP